MGPEASKGLWKVYNPLVQELLTRSVRLDRWHPLQADPRCRRTCDRYSAAQSVQRAHEHNGSSVHPSASMHVSSMVMSMCMYIGIVRFDSDPHSLSPRPSQPP